MYRIWQCFFRYEILELGGNKCRVVSWFMRRGRRRVFGFVWCGYFDLLCVVKIAYLVVVC